MPRKRKKKEEITGKENDEEKCKFTKCDTLCSSLNALEGHNLIHRMNDAMMECLSSQETSDQTINNKLFCRRGKRLRKFDQIVEPPLIVDSEKGETTQESNYQKINNKLDTGLHICMSGKIRKVFIKNKTSEGEMTDSYENDEEMYKCSLCSHLCPSLNTLVAHEKQTHKMDEAMMQCLSCFAKGTVVHVRADRRVKHLRKCHQIIGSSLSGDFEKVETTQESSDQKINNKLKENYNIPKRIGKTGPLMKCLLCSEKQGSCVFVRERLSRKHLEKCHNSVKASNGEVFEKIIPETEQELNTQKTDNIMPESDVKRLRKHENIDEGKKTLMKCLMCLNEGGFIFCLPKFRCKQHYRRYHKGVRWKKSNGFEKANPEEIKSSAKISYLPKISEELIPEVVMSHESQVHLQRIFNNLKSFESNTDTPMNGVEIDKEDEDDIQYITEITRNENYTKPPLPRNKTSSGCPSQILSDVSNVAPDTGIVFDEMDVHDPDKPIPEVVMSHESQVHLQRILDNLKVGIGNDDEDDIQYITEITRENKVIDTNTPINGVEIDNDDEGDILYITELTNINKVIEIDINDDDDDDIVIVNEIIDEDVITIDDDNEQLNHNYKDYSRKDMSSELPNFLYKPNVESSMISSF